MKRTAAQKGVFKITHIATGNCLIDTSEDLQSRFVNFTKGRLKSYKLLFEDIKKYKLSAFKFEVLITCTGNWMLKDLKQAYLDQHKDLAIYNKASREASK